MQFGIYQGAGFEKTRNRRVGATSRSSDPLGAGFYLYCNRKWRDPKKAEDMAAIVSGLFSLRQTNSNLRASLDDDTLISEISRLIEMWERYMCTLFPQRNRFDGLENDGNSLSPTSDLEGSSCGILVRSNTDPECESDSLEANECTGDSIPDERADELVWDGHAESPQTLDLNDWFFFNSEIPTLLPSASRHQLVYHQGPAWIDLKSSI
jgi:hypothetical protein